MTVDELRDELALLIHDPASSEVNRALLLTFINTAARDARNSGWLLPIEHAESVELLSNEFEYDIPTGFAFLKEIRTGDKSLDNASTVDTGTDIASAISDTTGTSVDVDDASIFVVNDLIQVDDEVMLITALDSSSATNTVTVTRGYFSTTAATHSSGASILRPLSDMDYDEIIPRAYWRPKLQSGGANATSAAKGSRAQVVFNSSFFSFTGGTPLQFVGQKRPNLYTVAGDTIDLGMESFLRERALFHTARYAAAGGSAYSASRRQISNDALLLSEDFLRKHPAEFRVLPNSVRIPGR